MIYQQMHIYTYIQSGIILDQHVSITCDHYQGILQHEYSQYTNTCKKCVIKPLDVHIYSMFINAYLLVYHISAKWNT
jgi:hypothetical protein